MRMRAPLGQWRDYTIANGSWLVSPRATPQVRYMVDMWSFIRPWPPLLVLQGKSILLRPLAVFKSSPPSLSLSPSPSAPSSSPPTLHTSGPSFLVCKITPTSFARASAWESTSPLPRSPASVHPCAERGRCEVHLNIRPHRVSRLPLLDLRRLHHATPAHFFTCDSSPTLDSSPTPTSSAPACFVPSHLSLCVIP